MTDIDAAKVMAAHRRGEGAFCRIPSCRSWPCPPYLLAEALAASEAKVAHAQRHGWDLGFKAGWTEHDERNHAGDTASRWWEGDTVNPFVVTDQPEQEASR